MVPNYFILPLSRFTSAAASIHLPRVFDHARRLAMVADFLIPFAIIGGGIVWWIWHELGAATKKYITEIEQKRQKQGLTAPEIPLP